MCPAGTTPLQKLPRTPWDITPIAITNNEGYVVPTLGRLTWAQRIGVIDSGRTDKTLKIVQCTAFAGEYGLT
jgi:hypothetical protein